MLKSALLARQVPAPKAGYDAKSIREPLASRFYQRRYAVSRDLHAVVRNRLLTGEALAIKVQPPASLTSQSVVIHGLRHQDLQQGMALEAALRLLLHFIGPRELVGYHIAYDLRILNLACQKLWGLTLPQRGIEVSQLYHDHLYRRYPDAVIDLHLSAICSHLELPSLPAHDALADATTAALIYLRLTCGSPLTYPKV